MTKKILILAVLSVFTAVGAKHQHVEGLCEGIVPDNNLNIPANSLFAGGIDEQTFNRVIDEVEAVYAPVVADKGGVLDIQRAWDDGTVNAYAERQGKNYIVKMFGGLARHQAITADGMSLVVCHELGHHLGGAPKIPYTKWASNEGQSDYFGGLKCLRKVWKNDDNIRFLNAGDYDIFAKEQCEKIYTNIDEIALCVRSSMAGMSLAKLFQDLRSETTPPKFETPDKNEVSSTADYHPDTQCRLDTYFAGAICNADHNVEVSNSDYKVGTCTAASGHTTGIRPRCWFKP